MKSLILEVAVIYLLLTFLLTCFMILKMHIVDERACCKKCGRARRQQLIMTGRWRQMPLYSMDEIAKNKKLSDVRLTVFPNDDGKKGAYAIILPGGGYAHCITVAEGWSVAARLNEMGVTAFVLEYRTGRACSKYAPMEDLARTVSFITEHSDEFNVEREGYSLIGFSAGGNLAGIYGTEKYGWKHYNTIKPGTIILGYPWTNINHWAEHPYWNIWEGLIGVWFSERGNIYMFGPFPTREERESLCVQNWIRPGYPPTYMFSGDDDILVTSGSHTDVMAKALKENTVPYMYQKFFRVPHGIGLGVGTNAEGWLDEAVKYWHSNIYRQE